MPNYGPRHHPDGWLARALVTADFNLRDIEKQAEGYLGALFPHGWHGWAFAPSDTGAVSIDVYKVRATPAAIAALHRAGFAEVVCHEHEASKLITCMCERHMAPE